MIWLYRIIFFPALFLALPYYGWRMWRRGGYRKDFSHRWGRLRNLPARRPGVNRIWIQAVSVGELLALGPLLEHLAAKGDTEVVLTTTTSTGRRIAEERYRARTVWRGIFPLDWWLFSRAAWNHIRPDLVLLMESELWPEHLHQAARRGVPVMLINGRMSDRSARRYRRFTALARPLLSPLSEVLAASDVDRERFTTLVPHARLMTAGNLKFDFGEESSLTTAERTALKRELGFADDDRIVVGASTWPGEEQALAQAVLELRRDNFSVRLLLVPRHAERRPEIERDLRILTPSVHFRSDAAQASASPDLYVADTTGELRRFLQLADCVFIGKSLPPHREGQTPIEAAAYQKSIVFGPGMSNFRMIAEELMHTGGASQVASASELAAHLRSRLSDDETRFLEGRRAREVFARHRGASNRIAEAIHRRLHACGGNCETPY